jgi:transaldolase
MPQLRTKVFADGADISAIAEAAENPLIQGFTTNPTLMRKAGVDNYEQFAVKAVEVVGGKPISFEVFSDDFDEMRQQARRIASWGDDVYVKIPVTNSTGTPSYHLIRELSSEGVQVNVTAVFGYEQIDQVIASLAGGAPSYLSVFAGRIADAGLEPTPFVRHAVEGVAGEAVEVIWASPREVLNAVQASECGCHIITMTNDLIAKLDNLGKDLDQFSLETVEMFRRDAEAAGYSV